MHCLSLVLFLVHRDTITKDCEEERKGESEAGTARGGEGGGERESLLEHARVRVRAIFRSRRPSVS